MSPAVRARSAGLRPRRRRWAPATATLALAMAWGCEASTGPADQVLELLSINAAALPGPYPDPQGCCPTLEVTAGALTLRPDGTLTQRLYVACRNDLPAGTTCEVTGDGTMRADGEYSRAEGYVRLQGGVRMAATFTDERVTVDVGVPASMGLYPRYLLAWGP